MKKIKGKKMRRNACKCVGKLGIQLSHDSRKTDFFGHFLPDSFI